MLFVTLVSLMFMPYSALANSIAIANNVSCADSIIIVHSGPEDNGQERPKSLMVVPFTTFYNSETCSILIYFNFNIGVIDIEILNTSTGHIETGSISSAVISNFESPNFRKVNSPV